METVALIFGGVVVSLLVQAFKKKFGTAKLGTMAFVVVLSIIGGIGYYLMSIYGFWESFVQILLACGAFYAFVIKNIE